MMVYTAENTWKVNKMLDKVFDANGLEYTAKFIESIDTETGEIVHIVQDHNGCSLIAHDKGELVRETVKIAAPVIVIFKRSE